MIQRLDGENYLLLHTKTKSYLAGKVLWENATPDMKVGITTLTLENRESFRKAHAAIVDCQLIHEIGLESPREVWKKLHEINRSNSIANRLYVETISNFKYESATMKEHLTMFQEIILKMQAARCGPEECDQVTRLI
jgi:hypothetical protein